MSPSLALESSIFLQYLMMAGGLIVIAGLILTILTQIFEKPLGGVWRTYRGWLIMAPLVFGTIFAGTQATIVGVGLLALFGFKEFARATGLYRDWGMTGTVYATIVAMTAVVFVTDPRTQEAGWYGLYMVVPVYAICIILVVPILRNRIRGQLQAMGLSILGFVYLAWMFSHLGFLANSAHAYGYLLYLIVAVEVNDISAFVFGKIFGRRPLRSEISPNKTWEGSLGAFGVSMLLPWLLHFSFPHFTTVPLLLTGLIVGIGGQLGDLTLSVIKRDLGVKDMGAAIPGHGGLLDRIDSLIFTAPLFFHMVRWFYDIY